MTKRYKLSIIIPVYNLEDKIARCIESVLASSYADYEIVLIDDGSTDDSAKICKKYVCNNVTYIYQHNAGVSAARNRGIKEASGEFVSFIDGDDYIEDDYLSRLMKCTKDGSVDLVVGNITYQHESWAKKTSIFDAERNEKTIPRKEVLRKFIENYELRRPVGYIISKSYLENTKLCFEEDMKYGEDALFAFNLIDNAKRIIYCAASGYLYDTTNVQSAQHSVSAESAFKRLMDYGNLFNQIEQKWDGDKDMFLDAVFGNFSYSARILFGGSTGGKKNSFARVQDEYKKWLKDFRARKSKLGRMDKITICLFRLNKERLFRSFSRVYLALNMCKTRMD